MSLCDLREHRCSCQRYPYSDQPFTVPGSCNCCLHHDLINVVSILVHTRLHPTVAACFCGLKVSFCCLGRLVQSCQGCFRPCDSPAPHGLHTVRSEDIRMHPPFLATFAPQPAIRLKRCWQSTANCHSVYRLHADVSFGGLCRMPKWWTMRA